MHSEELFTLDKALQYCDELKSQLSDAIGHIEALTKRYDHIDYMENICMLEKSSFALASPPYLLKRHCSTPKVSATARRTLELSPITNKGNASGNAGPISSAKRTVQHIKQNNNTIAVRALKVQRNIETMLNHLKVLQKIHQRNHEISLEQSLYQPCNNSMCGASSPGKLGHTHCGVYNWSINDASYSTFNTTMTPKKKHSHPYMTPLRKIQMQTFVAHNVLLKSC